jgi:hypothetical protein
MTAQDEARSAQSWVSEKVRPSPPGTRKGTANAIFRGAADQTPSGVITKRRDPRPIALAPYPVIKT